MDTNSEAPTYFENIDLTSMSTALFLFQRDFEVPPEVFVDLEKEDIQSRIVNYYEANKITTLRNTLSSAGLFSLIFKVVVSEMILKKIESRYKHLRIFTLENVHLFTNYNKLKEGHKKYSKELHQHLRSNPSRYIM